MQAPPSQNQLFQRVMIISLTFGILLGILLTIEGLNMSNYIARQVGAPLPVESLLDEFRTTFHPHIFLVFGAEMLLARKLLVTLGRLRTLGQPAEGSQAASEFGSLILGIYSLIVGGTFLLSN